MPKLPYKTKVYGRILTFQPKIDLNDPLNLSKLRKKSRNKYVDIDQKTKNLITKFIIKFSFRFSKNDNSFKVISFKTLLNLN